MILLVSQKDSNVDDPKAEDLRDFGTVSVIMRMLKLPDGRVRILVQGFSRAKVESFDDSKPYITAKVQPKTELQVTAASPELEAVIRNVKSSLEKMVSLGKNLSSDLVAIATNLDDPGRLSDLVASNLDLKVDKGTGTDGSCRSPAAGSRVDGEGNRSSRDPERHQYSSPRGNGQEPARVLSAPADESHPARTRRRQRTAGRNRTISSEGEKSENAGGCGRRGRTAARAIGTDASGRG